MFKKLRNKFLILSMIVTSLVLITSFAVIYAVTYKNIQSSNMEKLNESSLTSFLPSDIIGHLPQLLLPSDYRPSFTLILDIDGNLIENYSYIDMSQTDYLEAAQKAWQQKSATPIRINNRLWQYTISSQIYFTVSNVYGSKTTEGYKVSYLDVTESHQTLSELLITFLIVGACTLLAVFVVSLYFANNAVKPIKKAWDAQRQFVADASHELKTPLTIINSNYSVLVSKKDETIESQIKWLDYIKDGANRMDKLVGDLLYLAKTDSAEISNDTELFNISDTINNSIDLMEAVIKEKRLSLTKSIEPSIVANGNSEKFAQVVKILLDNAVKYTNEGGVIDVLLKQDKHNAIFTVSNTGDGIEKEHIDKIFNRFYRTDSSRFHDGSYGLGLSIAKALMENMGGKIYADSDVGKSTTFIVMLGLKNKL